MFARQNLRAVEVAAIGGHIEALRLQRRLCLLGHVGELGSIRAEFGHFMRGEPRQDIRFVIVWPVSKR